MKFHIWINAAQDHDTTVDVPLALLRQATNPVIQSYLDWVEETGRRGPHAGEGPTQLLASALYRRDIWAGGPYAPTFSHDQELLDQGACPDCGRRFHEI